EAGAALGIVPHGSQGRVWQALETKNAEKVLAMIATTQIILIDDNNAWLESLAEYFREHGLIVFTASDPRQGLKLLEGHAVNIVISDFNLPFMDGLQV